MQQIADCLKRLGVERYAHCFDENDIVGLTAKDNRLFVEAVIYRYRAGIPWRARTLWRPDQDTHALLALGQERNMEEAV